jgi:hypothetical protein
VIFGFALSTAGLVEGVAFDSKDRTVAGLSSFEATSGKSGTIEAASGIRVASRIGDSTLMTRGSLFCSLLFASGTFLLSLLTVFSGKNLLATQTKPARTLAAT